MISFTPYNITYLLSQALGVFAMYKFMKTFFDSRCVKKVIEAIVFIGYYLLTTSVYLIINIPIVNLCVNLVATFLLTIIYSSSIKKKLFVGLLIFVFGFCTEMVAVTLTGYINFPINKANNYDSIFGAVTANVLLYIMSMVASGFKHIKSDNTMPKSYWIALLTVPISSLYVLAMFFQSEGLSVHEISSSVGAILIVNFMVFFLFDRVSLLNKERQENVLITQQNEYYVNQLQLMENSYKISKKIRHDIKNHLLTINSFLKQDNVNEAQSHISSIIAVYQSKAEIVHTGFPTIDGLLNAKLQPVAELGVRANIKVSLPDDFYISSFDLTVILGNLIDNALQAVSLVNEEKYIDLRMDSSKGMLIIKVSNPYKAVICNKNGKLITSKTDKENHGYGLRNVGDVLKKYNGTSKIDTSENIFTITVALYLT